MAASLTVFIVLFFLSVVTRAQDSGINEGISSYCEKSRLYSQYYVPTPVECCDSRGSCEMYIKPGETKYGLTNKDPRWVRRHCSCDRALYECVSKPLENTYRNNLRRDVTFGSEVCFRRSRRFINGTIRMDKFVFVLFMQLEKPRKAEK